ncbi:MAG: sigma-70 family RNA polymerase sigma factor [Planctomycetota bacterium]
MSRELRRLRAKTSLPARLPPSENQLDRLASKLLEVHTRYQIPAAFELLFDIAGPLVARVALDLLEQRLALYDPDDVVARIFLELAATDAPLPERDDHAFRRHVRTIAEEVLVDAARQAGEERAPGDLLARPAPPSKIPETSDETPFGLPHEDLSRIIGQSFALMPELTQRCFHLHLVEGKSLPDIAHELGLSLAAVGRRMQEGRRQALEAAAQYYREISGEESLGEEPGDEEGEGGEP